MVTQGEVGDCLTTLQYFCKDANNLGKARHTPKRSNLKQ